MNTVLFTHIELCLNAFNKCGWRKKTSHSKTCCIIRGEITACPFQGTEMDMACCLMPVLYACIWFQFLTSVCTFAMLTFTPQILLQSLLTYFEKKQSKAHLLRHSIFPSLRLFPFFFVYNSYHYISFQTNILKETLLEKLTFKCFSFLRLLFLR